MMSFWLAAKISATSSTVIITAKVIPEVRRPKFRTAWSARDAPDDGREDWELIAQIIPGHALGTLIGLPPAARQA
ncbi:hypothetical protein GCM10009618_15650 [Nesterenkonia lacusekhoensis]